MAKIFKTKPQTMSGETLNIPVTIEGVEYPVGSMLMTNENGEQFILTAEQVAADFDEVKPRVRKPTETTPAV